MNTLRLWGMGSLFLILLGSALTVIFCKYHSRLLFMEIQQQESALDQYEVEWGQMQLELTMLTEHNRIEQFAVENLKLITPLREKTIYLKPAN
ncbi:MAG: cell division protein FtsL [Methylovulum sp.]|jgi:cell division protein FtsL